MSIFTSSNVIGKTILQQVLEPYNPSAAQTLTTTYTDIDGSDYSFTPVSASSEIHYEYSLMASTPDAVGIWNMKLMVDGVEETESKGGQSFDYQDTYDYQYAVPSWGTSAKTIKLQARDYTTAWDVNLHQLKEADGVASSALVRAVLKITEYE
tara:strand:+ start:88 stop:546 length:459 start_codon:yes stop_codon:yes gene_type:complete